VRRAILIGFSQPDGPVNVELESFNTIGKPVLDQDAFQQLLAAAYTLQTQNDRLLTNCAEADGCLLDLSKQIRVPDAISEPPLSKAPMSDPTTRCGSDRWRSTLKMQVFRSNELFWRTATAIAAIAVGTLLLGESVNSRAPLPECISLPPEIAQQEIPFNRVNRQDTESGRQAHRQKNAGSAANVREDSSKPPTIY